MDEITQLFLRTALRLDETAQELEAVVSDTNAVQAKYNTSLKRILDLIKLRDQNWNATARSSLSSLGAKLAIQQRTLDMQQDALAKARCNFADAQEDYALLAQTHSDRLAEMRQAEWTQQKRESALTRIVERMVFDLWKNRHKEQDGPRFQPPSSSHSYIAIGASRFLNFLIRLDTLLTGDPDYATDNGRYRPVSFLEIGCGQGRVVMLAQKSEIVLWDKLEGFDFNPDLIKSGQETLGLGDALFVADALEYDYSQHDVLYSFRPFGDLDMQARLEEKMVNELRKGGYILAPFALDLDRYPDLQRMGDDTEIWKKVA